MGMIYITEGKVSGGEGLVQGGRNFSAWCGVLLLIQSLTQNAGGSKDQNPARPEHKTFLG
jgi:hypothetical protein